MATNTLSPFTNGNIEFSANIYQELAKTTNENLLLCTLSMQIILALCRVGAKGKTAEEISKTLHLPEEPEEFINTLKELEATFHDELPDFYNIRSANKIYIQNGYEIKDEFKNIAHEHFFTEVENIDFAEKQTAAAEINKWVETRTNNQIKNIIDPKEVDKKISLLISTMTFQGIWFKKFYKNRTSKKPFYLNDGSEIQADTMSQTDSFRYYEDEDLDAKFLQMSFENGVGSMIIVLPNAKDGLTKLEENMSAVLKPQNFGNQRLAVTIPKFKIGTATKFTPILKSLGVKEAFETSADFSGITSSNSPFQISDVIQKTFIDVQEDGTIEDPSEGTEKRISGNDRKPTTPPEFHVNHPFIYLIEMQNVIVFVGRCNNPTN